MFPFHPFQLPSFNFGTNNTESVVMTPISDIESESKSVNGDLCQSFEALFSKEVEESTMSSEWTIKGNEQAAPASQVVVYGQNQLAQKETRLKEKVKERMLKNLKLFIKTDSKKLKEEKTQVIIKGQNDEQQFQEVKIQLQQNTQSSKSHIHLQRNKLTKYRQLLASNPCYAKLPQELLNLLQISQKLDNHLLTKKAAKYTDNLYNIFKTLFSDEEMSTIWSNVKKLMFIATDHYCIRIDPLKNLCLGLGQTNNTKGEVRKLKLRKMMGEYYVANKQAYEQQGIPQAYIEPIKTDRFYPQNLNLSPELNGQKKLSKKFIARLQHSALMKQSKLQTIEQKCLPTAPATPQSNSSQALPNPQQLQQFCDAITLIYCQKKVSHMYKSSLVEQIRKNTVFSLEKIFFFVKYITQEELFLEVVVKGDCKIFRLMQKEKDLLIEGLKAKKGN